MITMLEFTEARGKKKHFLRREITRMLKSGGRFSLSEYAYIPADHKTPSFRGM